MKRKRINLKQGLAKLVKNLVFMLALCAIIFGIIYLSTLIVALIMKFSLGEKVLLPVWTFVYQAASYTLALTILLLIPKIWRGITKAKLTAKLRKSKFGQKCAKNKFCHFLASDPLELKRQNTRDSLGLTGLPTWTDLGLAPIGFIVAVLVGQVLLSIFSLFPWFDVSQTQEVGFSTAIFGTDRLFAFVALCVIAPIAEELIFRGWLYGKQRRKSGAILAVLVNAIFFGALHGQWNVALTVGALGAVSCFLREITGTAYAGILLHIIKNSIAFILLFVYGL